jgi:hypothetical protein
LIAAFTLCALRTALFRALFAADARFVSRADWARKYQIARPPRKTRPRRKGVDTGTT